MHRYILLAASLCFSIPAVPQVACGGDESTAPITIRLVAGENFISLPLQPDNRSLAGVFGGSDVPGGSEDADSTLVYTYRPATGSSPAPVYYRLAESGHWMCSTGGVADDVELPADSGFNVRLPDGASPCDLVIRGRALPGPVTRELAGDEGATNYHIVSWPYPCPARVKELGLKEAGFSGGVNVTASDEIRILDNTDGQGSTHTPKARIWLDAKTSTFVFTAPRSGSAEDYMIAPGEALIVIRKRAPALVWTVKSSCP